MTKMKEITVELGIKFHSWWLAHPEYKTFGEAIEAWRKETEK